MIIGHLPLGYFTTKYLAKKLKLPLNKKWLLLGLLSAVIPDLDYVYWILSNSQSETHRGYFTSYPIFYLGLLICALIIFQFKKQAWLKAGIIVVFANIFIHFLADTVFYGIKWFYPLYNRYLGIYNVGGYGSGQGIQAANYYTHWYWYLEIVLWALAIVSVVRSSIKGEIR